MQPPRPPHTSVLMWRSYRYPPTSPTRTSSIVTGAVVGIPDPKHLESLVADLKTLSQLAEVRGQACDAAMRELSQRRKELVEEQREKEKADREAEEIREKMKKEAEEDDDEIRGRKAGKLKKRKDRSSVREERPPAHGAHGLAGQDGLDVPMEGTFIMSINVYTKTPETLSSLFSSSKLYWRPPRFCRRSTAVVSSRLF